MVNRGGHKQLYYLLITLNCELAVLTHVSASSFVRTRNFTTKCMWEIQLVNVEPFFVVKYLLVGTCHILSKVTPHPCGYRTCTLWFLEYPWQGQKLGIRLASMSNGLTYIEHI